MAFLARCWSFFAINMTALTGLVSPIFAKAFNFARTFFVTFLAVTNSGLVGFVIEFYTFFHFDDITGKSSTSNNSEKCNKSVFHFYNLRLNFKIKSRFDTTNEYPVSSEKLYTD